MSSEAISKNRGTQNLRRGTKTRLALGALLLLLPTMAPECDENEPNNTVGESGQIRLHEFGYGQINPVGDVDFWWTRDAAVGDLVFAYVDTHMSSTGTDSVFEVFAHDETSVESDDDDGPGASSVVAGAIIPQAGNVFYRINEYFDNDTITQYYLYQAVLNPADSATEAEGNDIHWVANTISAPIMVGDVVNGSGDVDFFRFNAPMVLVADGFAMRVCRMRQVES